jgi:hypothetical protein
MSDETKAPTATHTDEKGGNNKDNNINKETLSQRSKRCIKGIVYDFANWNSVVPPTGEPKIRYILTRDDRSPISSASIILLTALIIVCLTRR